VNHSFSPGRVKTGSSLEDQLQRQLELPWVHTQIRPGDLAESARTQNRIGTHGSGFETRDRRTPLGDIDVRLTEVFRVGDVIHLGAELQLRSLRQLEVFEDLDVRTALNRTVTLRSGFVPVGANRWSCKCRSVDPVQVILVVRRIGYALHDVGTIGHDQVTDV